MLKQKRKFCVILYASSVPLIIFFVAVMGTNYSPIPKARITNVDCSIVAEILCLKENELANMGILSIDPEASFKKAVECALATNRQRVTAQYELDACCLAKMYRKETVLLDTRQPDQTTLSIRCLRKDDPGHSGSLFPRYKRDYAREYQIMTQTVQQLKADHQAQIEWLDGWRPENSKQNWPDDPPCGRIM